MTGWDLPGIITVIGCIYTRIKEILNCPFLPYPKNYPRYISRLHLIEYLESYAQKFQLDIRFHQEVISAHSIKDQWEVKTQDNLYHTKNLVIAAGCNHEPVLPGWPGQDSFKGTIIHSSQYKNGELFKANKVLAVGFGNSGGEIAIGLWEHGAQVSLAVRNAVNVIPRELFRIPILSISILESKLPPRIADAINTPILRIAIGDITRYGLRKLSYGPLTQIQRDGHIPLIDSGHSGYGISSGGQRSADRPIGCGLQRKRNAFIQWV
jgi:indole-3-pyruvate monooxygenase